ncbi:MAG: PKD domain-containing protein [Thiotrichales bacterium]
MNIFKLRAALLAGVLSLLLSACLPATAPTTDSTPAPASQPESTQSPPNQEQEASAVSRSETESTAAPEIPSKPVASFTVSTQQGPAPLLVQFDASDSTDSDGYVLGYDWLFGDGNRGNSINPQNTFKAPGVYEVSLVAMDNEGNHSVEPYLMTITVEPPTEESVKPNTLPQASFTMSATEGKAPLAISLDAQASSDADGAIVSYQWQLSNGQIYAGAQLNLLLEAEGDYAIDLTVTDDRGGSATTTHRVLVTPAELDASPVALFTADPLSGTAPLDVTLDAASAYDNEGPIVSWAWDFGDGATGEGEQLSHQFTDAGLFNVTLTVTDQSGKTSAISRTVNTQGSLPSRSVYHIGNSVTDGVKYQKLAALAQTQGKTHSWARHMIPGAPLEWIWTHPNDGFKEDPYGYYPQALPNYAWDAVIAQPFDRPLDNTVKYAGRFFDLALQGNADTQLYILAFYPRRNWEGWGNDWEGQWLADSATSTSKAFFETVAQNLTTSHPNARKVLLIPAGEVMYQLNLKINAGQVPGYTSIWDLYADDVHLTETGSYLLAVTHYTTLYREDPRSLGLGDYDVQPDIAQTIREVAWEVVSSYEWAGVK